MQALRTMLGGLSLADLTLSAGTSFDYSVGPGDFDLFQQLRRALEAINSRNFSQHLTHVKARFNRDSTVDIRGCRVAQDVDYIEAWRDFFSPTGAAVPRTQLPHVTGPDWFQGFPTVGGVPTPDEHGIDDLIANGTHLSATVTVPASELVAAFDAWADDVLVNADHMTFWRNLFAGTAINFCLLTWRTRIPPIGLESGRLAGIAGLDFAHTVERVKDIFNVTTAVPSASTLNNLSSFVNSANQHLTATLPPSPTNTQLLAAHQQLLQISNQVGQTIVPTTPPAGLSTTIIQGWKTQLTNFIENTHLAAIKTLLTACAAKANHANAKYRYFLFLGLPALIYTSGIFLHSFVIALSSQRNEAIRRLLRSYWAEPLPASNTVGAAQFDTENSRQVCMLTFDYEHTDFELCPRPGHDNHIIKRPLP
jgi:hypothetical protein